MNLSKSQYIRGLQCHKSLWLYKNKPELRDKLDEAQESLFETGHTVGELARKLFPNGVEIAFDTDDFSGMIEKTKALIADGTEVIYEATFSENGIFAMADILVRNGDAWDMYEVKGSTEVKSQHLDDAAIQWYALSNRLTIGKAYIVYIDNTYVRKGELDIHALFSIVDVTDEVKSKQEEIPLRLREMERLLQEKMPDIDIGRHCDDPYSCDFHTHCWQHIPAKHSVFDLTRAMGKQWRLYEEGIVHFDDIPEGFSLGAGASLQLEHYRSGKVKTDCEKIKDFLETIVYPINFFDFETYQEAIPRFDDQRPYAQMPFQYSLHILHEDGTLEHKEFLGDEHHDPRRELAERMLQDITPTGSIVAYHASFEQTQIRTLAALYEEISEQLLALNERFVDLEVPFRSKSYYHPGFNGRSSIKVVLPTMFPDDPELDYQKLGSIRNGGEAMNIFAKLHLLKDKTQREQIRADLLAYCRLDTLAMVRIWEKLHDICRNHKI
jgi:predicted RecB family nuclease